LGPAGLRGPRMGTHEHLTTDGTQEDPGAQVGPVRTPKGRRVMGPALFSAKVSLRSARGGFTPRF
jgi:hypothetical protein